MYFAPQFLGSLPVMIEKERLDVHQLALSGPEGLKAYEAIFHMVFADLLRFAISIVHFLPMAEEVVSDVLIQVWQRRMEMDAVRDLRLYLYTSTRNRSINYLKSKRLQISENVQDTTINWDDVVVQLKSNELDPEAQIEFSELNQKVNKAIEGLPPKCKLIYQLVKEGGLKYKDVAAILDISVKTIEAQMTIAFKRLHEALD